MRKPSSLAELKRKQTTAVILLGVIGAEFGQDITADGKARRHSEDRRRSSVVEGFGKKIQLIFGVLWFIYCF